LRRCIRLLLTDVRVLKSGKVSFTLHGRFPGSGAFTRRALGGYGELILLEARSRHCVEELLLQLNHGIER
jgi:hypothetical protein